MDYLIASGPLIFVGIALIGFFVWVRLWTNRYENYLMKRDDQFKAISLQTLELIRNKFVTGVDNTSVLSPGVAETYNWRSINQEIFDDLKCPFTSNGRCERVKCPAYREKLKNGKDGCIIFQTLFELSS